MLALSFAGAWGTTSGWACGPGGHPLIQVWAWTPFSTRLPHVPSNVGP